MSLLVQRNNVSIDKDDVQVDPLLLFQRLITVAQTSDELESAFRRELCSYPPALFDSSLLLREAHKLALADAMWGPIGPDVRTGVPDDGSRYVVDGTHSTHTMVSLVYIRMHLPSVHRICKA